MNLNEYKINFEKALDFLRKELGGLRTGRATPALVEDIICDAYDAKMEIKGLASIQNLDSRTLIIEPWDKSVLKNIEKGIQAAGIGLNPIVDGPKIRIAMPALTEENRKELVKVMGKKMEEAKMAMRNVRDEIKGKIEKAEEDGEIAEDERFRLQDQLDEMTRNYNEKIKTLGEEKEKEIMTI
jgi:ribosome recycling factor